MRCWRVDFSIEPQSSTRIHTPREGERAARVRHDERSQRRVEFGDALAQYRLQAQQARSAKTAQQADRRVVRLIEAVAAVEHVDMQIAMLAQAREAAPLAQHGHQKRRIFSAPPVWVAREGIAAAEQGSGCEVERIRLIVPIVPVHLARFGEKVQLIAKEAAVALCGAKRIELRFQPPRMVAVVVVPLADVVAARRANRCIAQCAERLPARELEDADRYAIALVREAQHVFMQFAPTVVNDDQLAVTYGLGAEVRDGAAEYTQPPLLCHRETAYHPRSLCKG